MSELSQDIKVVRKIRLKMKLAIKYEEMAKRTKSTSRKKNLYNKANRYWRQAENVLPVHFYGHEETCGPALLCKNLGG